jgi:SAM-dependent methyltransferase
VPARRVIGNAGPGAGPTMLRAALSSPASVAVTQALLGIRGGRDRLFRDWIRVSPGAHVLDVGCGIGSLSRHFGPDVVYVGVDLEWRHLRHGAGRCGPRASFVRCDVTRTWPFRGHGFDCVFGFGLLHHLSDDQARFMLGESRRMLKHGGVLYTADPFAGDGQSWVKRTLLAMDRGEHIRRAGDYRRLVESVFTQVSATTSDGLLRVPYDLLMMRCQA